MLTTKGGDDVPHELARAIEADGALVRLWERARPSCQKRYAEHVAEARKPETRERRAAAMLRQMQTTYGRPGDAPRPGSEAAAREGTA